eukprot:CAMPEP_0195572742 /NCGR_PEP_ID=MMETSP0814-20130614/4923_1 /TAXON_ID=97485 /ORGANISM="Prymnesium parvum, Strain Texoma1" /LENGTH=74 /DNA_ID=CAMNT_0040708543 /DNA_START=405 /DNA_END=626 /DNA_ORIENTATION=+
MQQRGLSHIRVAQKDDFQPRVWRRHSLLQLLDPLRLLPLPRMEFLDGVPQRVAPREVLVGQGLARQGGEIRSSQ